MLDRVFQFFEKWSDKIVWVFIFTYIIIFSYICYLKFSSFSYHDWDFASGVITFWTSIHGKLLYLPFLEEVVFGAHLYLIQLLFIPIYAIFQHPVTLLFLQTIFLGIAAYPLYLLARLKLSKIAALVVIFTYLLYPPLGYINLFETHFDSFTIFPLAFALYYFEKRSFKKFLLFIFLAMSCKESVSLLIIAFGIYAFIRRRTKKWIIVPILAGFFWFLASVKFVIPYFAKDAKLYPGGFIFSLYYQHLGKTIPQMLETILFHPIAVAGYIFTKKKLIYLFQLFLPTGFLVVLSPAVLLITIPIFLQNLLSAAPTTASIYYQYTAMLLPFVLASYISALRNLLSRMAVRNHQFFLLGACLMVSIGANIYLKGPQLELLKYIRAYRIDELVKEKNKLVKLIPKNAPTISTFQFLPKLANRHDLYSMHFVSSGFKMYTNVKYEPPLNLEYALVDFNEPLMINSFFPPEAPKNMRGFLEDNNWRVLKAVDDVVLFKKNYFEGEKICEIIAEPKIQNIINVNIDNKIIFIGFDVESKNIKPGDMLHFTYYWKRIGNLSGTEGFFLQFIGSGQQVILQKIRIPGYRIYPLSNLPNEHILKEENWIFMPSNIRDKEYNIRIGLFSLSDGKILPVLNKEKVDNIGRIILTDVFLKR